MSKGEFFILLLIVACFYIPLRVRKQIQEIKAERFIAWFNKEHPDFNELSVDEQKVKLSAAFQAFFSKDKSHKLHIYTSLNSSFSLATDVAYCDARKKKRRHMPVLSRLVEKVLYAFNRFSPSILMDIFDHYHLM